MLLIVGGALYTYFHLTSHRQETQHRATLKESGYWFDESGAHLRQFYWTDDNEVTELES